MSEISLDGVAPARRPHHDGSSVESLLTAVQHCALTLCAESPRLPAHLEVRVGDVAVELSWPDHVTAPVTEVPAQRQPAVSAMPTAPTTPTAPVALASPPDDQLATAPGSTGGGRQPEAGHGQGDEHDDGDLVFITSPTVGIFYLAPEPGAKPFVQEGDMVVRGQQVAIIEVMKLMLPVEAEQSGHLVGVHPADATSVEFGERLFSLRTADTRVG